MDRAVRSPPVGPAAMAAAMDHVLLSYLYLDDGNLDGYASLLDDAIQLKWPGLPRVTGRPDVLAQLARITGPPGRHRLYRMVANGDCIVTQGRCTGRAAQLVGGAHRRLEFVDVCTVTATGLILAQRRYFDLPPN